MCGLTGKRERSAAGAARAHCDQIFRVSEMRALISNSGESIFRLLVVILDRRPHSVKQRV